MDKKLTPRKFDPHEMNKHTLQYKPLLTTQQNTNIPYNYSAFLSDEHLCTHQLEYVTKGHIATHTILF